VSDPKTSRRQRRPRFPVDQSWRVWRETWVFLFFCSSLLMSFKNLSWVWISLLIK